MPLTDKPWLIKLNKFKNGQLLTKTLKQQNLKPNKKNLSLFSTQLCKKSIKPLEDNLVKEDSQEDSQEDKVFQVKDQLEDQLQDQLSIKSIDL